MDFLKGGDAGFGTDFGFVADVQKQASDPFSGTFGGKTAPTAAPIPPASVSTASAEKSDPFASALSSQKSFESSHSKKQDDFGGFGTFGQAPKAQ